MNPIKVRFSEKEVNEILKKTVLNDSKLTDQKKKELQDILIGKKAVKA